MKTKSIRQTINFLVQPDTVYDTLMDSRKHSKFTGDAARISRKVGGKFTAYGSYVSGANLELKENKKIVQSWRGSDWPEGHYSKATFSFVKTKTGTRLTFKQTGVPADYYESIKEGWIEFYWNPMKVLFQKPK